MGCSNPPVTRGAHPGEARLSAVTDSMGYKGSALFDHPGGYVDRRECPPGGALVSRRSLTRPAPCTSRIVHRPRGLGLLASALRLTPLLEFDLAHSTPSTDADLEVECMSLNESLTTDCGLL
jgi:hypothetical protein